MPAFPDPTIASVFRPRTTIAPDGSIEGYASLFGEIDAARDMVMPGAFAGTLKRRGLRRIPMLFQHDPAEPIGIWLELREDHRGLYARGRLIPEVMRARELLALLKAGTADGLSIGFKTLKARVDPKTRVRKLVEVDLWEISLVTFPLLTGARVHAVKENGFGSRPVSVARTRAEKEWRSLCGVGGTQDSDCLRHPEALAKRASKDDGRRPSRLGRTQVGCSRLAHQGMPISGKPEIGATSHLRVTDQSKRSVQHTR